MKLSKLFDAKIIASGIVSSLAVGAILFYFRNSVPGLREIQRGYDGGAA